MSRQLSVDPPVREVPEAVLGADNRVAVRDTSVFPWSAICQLEAVFPSGAALTGTAALVGPTAALTAAHCVYDHRLGGMARRVVVRAGLSGKPVADQTAVATRLCVPPAWQQRSEGRYDLALLGLDRALGYRAGWFRFGTFAPARLHGALINLSGYPVDRPVEPISLRGRVQFWSLGTVLEARPGRLVHTADSYYGHSGAPLWVRSRRTQKRLLVAVHSAAARGRNVAVALDSSRRSLLRAWIGSVG